ncbi:MAG: glycosyl hydrolase [bacterium]|nr:glycosyl hydrolase [bacterium]
MKIFIPFLYRVMAIFFVVISCISLNVNAQTVPVGNGSYTTVFPGVDEAGRNTFPSGTPYLSGSAANKPVPTNDWWSDFIKSGHGGKAFNYPLSFRSKPEGLVVNYTIPLASTATDYREPISAFDAIVVGTEGLSASNSTASDHTDWGVTFNWNDDFYATVNTGSPFVYFEKNTSANAKIDVNFNSPGVTVDGNKLIIQGNMNQSNYVVFGPTGSTWSGSGGEFTSSLNGENYWSMVMLPPGSDLNTAINYFEQFAYVFPSDTRVDWDYNETTGAVRTTFSVTPDVKEGANSTILQGLLPHHWDRLASNSPQPSTGYLYPTVRGTLQMIASNTFIVENTFSGILPTMPDLGKYTDGFDPGALSSMINLIKNDGLATWTDSYNEGQAMNRLIQAARIADQLGNIEARDQMVNTVRTRLEDWLTAESGEVAFLFYYNSDWSAILGYPAGHRQDENLNDHHFHWGYFIHAAAAIEQYFPGWTNQWGDMINVLIRDAANPSRTDDMFPFLRNFSPYGGHSWANGFATEPNGNDQESTSESMQFNSALIHWGTLTGNDEIRDLGVYLYTTELSTIQEYWFDVEERSFQPEYAYEMVARVWSGGYDNGTWWTNDVAASYGIQLYPIHAGSLYLGHRTDYINRVWTEMTQNTDVLNNIPNVNLWYDTYWKFYSFLDPQQALNLYRNYTDRDLKFGVSDAQTYHWLHAMAAMGQVQNQVTADYPIAAAFSQNGSMTYVAHNYSNSSRVVNFSDGFTLTVPPNSMATNRDSDVQISLTSSELEVPIGGNVNLSAAIDAGSGVTNVEFYANGNLIGSDNSAPYNINSGVLPSGFAQLYAKAYQGSNLSISNVVAVQVGSQLAYSGTPSPIPGTIEAGHFDVFEAGVGQGIAYSDNDQFNQGDFRASEWVDASATTSEGATVGWIDPGEWLEYTVNVAQTGQYDITLRFASGNSNGGGPFWFESNGTKISGDILVGTTGDWGAWQDVVAENVSLSAGEQVLRLAVGSGGFNLGRMTFEFTGNSTPVLSSIQVTPANANIDQGQTQQFVAQGFDQFGSPFAITPTWSVDGGSVDNSGLFTGTVDGNFTVTATQGSISGEATIAVSSNNPPVLTSIQVTPSNSNLTLNETQQFSAQGLDQFGNPISANVTWASSGGSISSTGLYTADAIGSFVITASDGSVSGDATVSITNTTATCSGGPSNGDYTYTISSDSNNPSITFNPGYTGVGDNIVILFYGTTPGGGYPGYIVLPGVPFEINASQGQTVYFYYTYSVPEGGERNTAADMHDFEVGNCGSDPSPILTSIEITPDNISINEGDSQQFTAQAYDQNENPMNASVNWSSNGGSIDSNGLFTGNISGSYVVTATSGSVSASASVTVNASSSGWMIPGRVEAENYNSGGEGAGYHDLTAGNTGGAFRNEDVDIETTGDQDGAYNVGWIDATEWLEFDITASQTGNYKFDFRVASPNGAGRFHIEIDGVNVSGEMVVPNTGSWQSYSTISTSDIAVASGNHKFRIVFDASGLNLNYFEASSVASQVLTSIVVSPNSVSIEEGASQQFVAQGYDQNGSPMTAAYNWSSTGGTINGNGNFTGTNSGAFSITAASSGVAGSANIIVNASSTTCTGSGPNDDYSYQIADGANPSITFEPGYAGVGSGIVILYYGTNPTGGYPGYVVAPNTPFALTNVTQGETIYFYYTYSVPEGGERNSAANRHDFVVGNCGSNARSGIDEPLEIVESTVELFPVPASKRLILRGAESNSTIRIFDVAGRKQSVKINEDENQYIIDVSDLARGHYLLSIITTSGEITKRFLKQ